MTVAGIEQVARQLAVATQPPRSGMPTLVRRQGSIVAASTGNPRTVDVSVSGLTILGVRYLASYSPVVGDVVFIDFNGPDPMVIGVLAGANASSPAGAIQGYWGTSVPIGWLVCNGAAFSGTTYPVLAALLGGTTLPDLRGKVLVGVDGTSEFAALGTAGGSRTSTALHNHGLGNHSHTASTTSDSNHSHALDNAYTFGTSNTAHTHYVGGGPGENSAAPQGAGRAASNGGNTAGEIAGHSHNVSVTTPSPNTSDGSSAGLTSGNLQPYTSINWIIKT